MPQKYFNTAGPCNPSDHYMLNPLRDIGDELINLIDTKQYFVIHAARQSGKTTLLWELTDKINAKGEHYALYCSLEALQDGHISREMALGKNRADICIEWQDQKYPIELKLYKGSKTTKDATEQILKYMDSVGSKEGWVVIFDRASKKSWSRKLYVKEVKLAGRKKITFFGC
jgi:hypothetical protein